MRKVGRAKIPGFLSFLPPELLSGVLGCGKGRAGCEKLGKWEFSAFLLGILGWDCVIKHRNEQLEYDGSLEFLDYEEKLEVEQEIPPEHEKKCYWF